MRDRIMQTMRPDIPPEPIQPHLPRRRSRPRHFKNTPGNPQRRIGRHDLDARNPLRHLSSLRRRYIPLFTAVGVDGRDLGTGEIG